MNLHVLKRYSSVFVARSLLYTLFLLMASTLALATPSVSLKQHNVSRHSIGLRLGSAGWGGEYKAHIHQHLDLRLVWQTLSPGRFDVNTDRLSDTIPATQYRAHGSFRSNGFISDWYPWKTPIRFSFGVLQNRSEFRLTETVTSGPINQYSANFGQLSYFFGTGWAPRSNSSRFSLTLDVGLLAQQPPRLTWVQDSVVRNTAETDRIWSERLRLEQAFEEYKILPVFMIGLSYKLR